MNPKLFALLMLSLILVPLAMPAAAAQVSDLTEPLKMAIGYIVDIFSLSFLDGNRTSYVAMTRFLIWLVTFTIIFEILTHIPNLPFSKKGAQVIAFAMATMSAIFMPDDLLLGIGESYAAAIALAAVAVLVFVSWSISRSLNLENSAQKMLFVMINLAVIAMLAMINKMLVAEGKPSANFIGGLTIASVVGTAITVAMVWQAIRVFSAIFAGTGGALNKAWLGGIGQGSKDATKERGKAAEDVHEAAVGAKEMAQAAQVGEQLAAVDARLEAALAQADTNALGALNDLANLLEQLQKVAQQVEQVRSPELAQRYQQMVAAAAGKVAQLVENLRREGTLADQQVDNLRREILLVRNQRKILKDKIFDPLAQHQRDLERARSAEKPKGKYRQVKGNDGLYNQLKSTLDGLRSRSDNLIRKIDQLERIESRLTSRAKREIQREVAKLNDVERHLGALAAKPDSKAIGDIAAAIRQIAVSVNQRVQSYRLGAGAGSVAGTTATVAGIQDQLRQIDGEIAKIVQSLQQLDAQEAAQAAQGR